MEQMCFEVSYQYHTLLRYAAPAGEALIWVSSIVFTLRLYSFPLLKITMASNSDNQILASRARAIERQGQGQYDGGQCNQWQSKQGFEEKGRSAAGKSSYETLKFNRNQIVDQRCKKYNKKGVKIDMYDDPLCNFICIGTHITKARELTRLQKICMVPALAGENPSLTQINVDIISEHLNLNITPMRPKIIASVLNLTYKLLGVKENSLTNMISRNYPV